MHFAALLAANPAVMRHRHGDIGSDTKDHSSSGNFQNLIVHCRHCLVSSMASMFSNSGLPGSIHGDVLNANPTEADEVERLVEEIKGRAKNSIKYGNFPEAIQLYSKAIELLPANAILHANRSMCHCTMGSSEPAVSDAEKATELDPSYAKGFYRLGSALFLAGKYAEAKEGLEKGLNLVPNDKDMTAKLKAVEDAMKKNGSNCKAPQTKSNANTVTSTSSSNSLSEQRSNKPVTSKKLQKPNDVVDEDGEDLRGLRGYKKTSDGRTTSYFNNELDEKTKSLIGDITPKAISAADANNSSVMQNGGSAWNTAGTFESRNVTPWAKERMKELLSNAEFEGGACIVSVVNVKDINGDAEITMNRGKRKFLCDFDATIEWKLVSDGTKQGTGSMVIRDINSEKEYDYQVTVDSSNNKEVALDVNSYVKSGSIGLQQVIRSNLDIFFAEFHSM